MASSRGTTSVLSVDQQTTNDSQCLQGAFDPPADIQKPPSGPARHAVIAKPAERGKPGQRLASARCASRWPDRRTNDSWLAALGVRRKMQLIDDSPTIPPRFDRALIEGIR